MKEVQEVADLKPEFLQPPSMPADRPAALAASAAGGRVIRRDTVDIEGGLVVERILSRYDDLLRLKVKHLHKLEDLPGDYMPFV